MNFNGSFTIAATPEEIWRDLQSPEVLKGCIPGCSEVTGSVDTGYDAVVVQKIGPVKATFRGKVLFDEVVPGESFRLSGEGSGGIAGFAKGAARVTLTPAAEGTVLSYAAEANVGGKIAQLGARLIDSFAQKMIGSFFEGFSARFVPQET